MPLYREHREYFYDWCTIGSIYGAPAGCIWGGGRISCGGAAAREVLALLLDGFKLTEISFRLQKSLCELDNIMQNIRTKTAGILPAAA